jgi:hypothetical protein
LTLGAWQVTVEIGGSMLNMGDTWTVQDDRTQGNASGRYAEYPFVFVTALSFEEAYKYLLTGSMATLLDILTSF